MTRTATTCDHCGGHDDHPKAHLGLVTKHHDCLSVVEEQTLRDSAQPAGAGPKVSAVINACKGGKRGENLLALIRDPAGLPQAEGLHEKAQRESEKKGGA